MDKPMVSVIMSVYNETRQQLSESIDSVLRQTFRDFEFIIVCDNPGNPEAGDFIDSYAKKDNRIRAIRNNRNEGLARSLNTALAVSRGEFIARMDADDIAFPSRLQKQVDFLQVHPEVSLVGSSIVYIDEDKDVIGSDYAVADSRLLKDIVFFVGTPCFHPTWLFRRSILERLKGYRDLPASQDYDFLMRLLSSGYGISNIEEPLLYYRIRKDRTGFEKGFLQWRLTRYIRRAAQGAFILDDEKFSPEKVGIFVKQPALLYAIDCFSVTVRRGAYAWKQKGHVVLAFIWYIFGALVCPYKTAQAIDVLKARIFFISRFGLGGYKYYRSTFINLFAIKGTLKQKTEQARPARVCFLCPKAYPLFNPQEHSYFGGTQVQLFLLAQELSQRSDMKVSMIVADYGQPQKETYGAIEVLKSFNFQQSFFHQVAALVRAIRQADADVYIQSTLTPFSGLIAVLCKILGKKFVYRLAHDLEVNGIYEKEKGRFISFVSKLAFSQADLVIAQTQYQYDLMMRRGVRRCLRIPSGVVIQAAPEARENFILWVGRATEMKRPDTFIRLAKEMPDFNFVMIVSGSLGYYRTLQQHCAALLNMSLHYSLSFDETAGYFRRAKIFVSTSEMEGFPVVFLQAGVSAAPVVSLHIDSDGMLSKEGCGIYARGDFGKLKEAISKLMADDALYRQLSEQVYMFTKEHHDITQSARRFYDAVMKL